MSQVICLCTPCGTAAEQIVWFLALYTELHILRVEGYELAILVELEFASECADRLGETALSTTPRRIEVR